jgi:nucleotide sugar dehydrogenase
MKSIGFIGLGYVGLTSAICFSFKGYTCYGYDIDKEKIKKLKDGILPIYEKDLDKYFIQVYDKSFIPTDNLKELIENSKLIFITVGTPSREDGSINLQYVEEACKNIGECLKEIKNDYKVIIIKSTVIPGTTENLALPIIEKFGIKLGKDFGLVVNPEFLREGNAVYDTLNPDRIIIGYKEEKDGNILEEFYKEIYKENIPPILKTNFVNAELIKYANNAFLATKISFINMIANLCQTLKGADVEEIAKGIGLDKRIGKEFLKAGLGYGGSCFPKDLEALLSFAKKLNVELPLLEATIKINNNQYYKAIEMAKIELKNLKGRTISILGLSFKANTDDIRNAVSIKIVNELLKEGANIKVYDPKAMENFKKLFNDKNIYFAKNVEDCLESSECAIIVTEWEEFKRIKPETFLKLMKYPLVIDGRRIYQPNEFKDKLIFKAIGYNN